MTYHSVTRDFRVQLASLCVRSACQHCARVLSILRSKLSAKIAHVCWVLLCVAQAMHLLLPVRCYDLASTWHMPWQVQCSGIFQHLLLQHAPPIFTPRFAARAKLLSPAALMQRELQTHAPFLCHYCLGQRLACGTQRTTDEIHI